MLAGRIGLDDARRERFRRVFAALGVALATPDEVDAVASAYRAGYMTARRALDGAAELLRRSEPHARIGIVTNNLLEEQQDKLQLLRPRAVRRRAGRVRGRRRLEAGRGDLRHRARRVRGVAAATR